MYTREMFIESVQNEARILAHLYTKVKPEMLSYRPTPGQRSLQELLCYLPMLGGPLARTLVSGDWAGWEALEQRISADAKRDFPGTMQKCADDFAAVVRSASESDLMNKDVTTPIGVTPKMGQAFVDWNMKFLTAYRMQFFLYLKSCGRADLGTWNLWGGTDIPPKM